jgi:protein-S-isoprenylcysteine O-methyltransferase Ste14
MPMTLHDAPELVTSGPYAYVRHPIYTGVLAMLIGTAFVYPLALMLMAAATLVVAVSPNIWVAAAAMAFSGIGNGAAFVINVLLVQRGAPDAVRGRAFSP